MDAWNYESAKDLELPLSDRLRCLRRECGLVSSTLHLGWWTLVRGYLGLWHRLIVIGREHLPAQPPYILVANHASHLDALVLAAPLPWRLRDRIFPIAAGDVFFETPWAAAFAAGMLNALPMWRHQIRPRDLATLRERLIEDAAVFILFPEGTRSRDGTMSPFKPGLGMLVAETQVPIVPCYLEGCHAALKPHQRIPRPRSIRLHIGRPLEFADVAHGKVGWRAIAAQCEAEVRALIPATTG